MHFLCRSFIGRPTSQNWSQFWENEPDDRSLYQTRGHLFGLITVKSTDFGQEATLLGHQSIADFDQSYFSHPDRPVLPCLLASLQVLDKDTTSCISLATIIDSQLFLTLNGQSFAVIIRSGRTSSPLFPTVSPLQISGTLQSSDRLFLGSTTFLDHLGWEKLKEILSADSITQIEENILSFLNALPDQTGCAAALIEMQSDTEESITAPPSAPIVPLASPSPSPQSRHSPHLIKRLITKFSQPSSVTVSPLALAAVSRRQKINLIVAFIILIALSVSIFYGYQKNQALKIENNFQALKTNYAKTMSDAVAVKSLSLDSAYGLAKQADELVSQMAALKIHPTDVSQMKSEVDSILNTTGSSLASSDSLFYDTSLITDNPQYNHLFINNNQLILLDTVKGRLDSVDDQKATQNLSQSTDLKNAISLAFNTNQVYMLTSGGLLLVAKSGLTSQISFSGLDQAVTPVSGQFWNGAFYLLDSQKPTIWKFAPNSTDFSPGQEWLKSTVSTLSQASGLAINGKVWVLLTDGTIIPFLRGQKDNFQSAYAAKLLSAKNLVVGADTDRIAFTQGDSLIYVLNKEGQSLAKFNLGDKKINAIALDDTGNAVYSLCSDQKIYKLSL